MTVAAPSANGASTSRTAAPRINQRPRNALELIRRDEGMPAPPPASVPLAAGFTTEQVAALAAPEDY